MSTSKSQITDWTKLPQPLLQLLTAAAQQPQQQVQQPQPQPSAAAANDLSSVEAYTQAAILQQTLQLLAQFQQSAPSSSISPSLQLQKSSVKPDLALSIPSLQSSLVQSSPAHVPSSAAALTDPTWSLLLQASVLSALQGSNGQGSQAHTGLPAGLQDNATALALLASLPNFKEPLQLGTGTPDSLPDKPTGMCIDAKSQQLAFNQVDGLISAREKNRQAQRRFRERQKNLIGILRDETDQLKQKLEEQKREIAMLRDENALLRAKLQCAPGVFPAGQFGVLANSQLPQAPGGPLQNQQPNSGAQAAGAQEAQHVAAIQ